MIEYLFIANEADSTISSLQMRGLRHSAIQSLAQGGPAVKTELEGNLQIQSSSSFPVLSQVLYSSHLQVWEGHFQTHSGLEKPPSGSCSPPGLLPTSVPPCSRCSSHTTVLSLYRAHGTFCGSFASIRSYCSYQLYRALCQHCVQGELVFYSQSIVVLPCLTTTVCNS